MTSAPDATPAEDLGPPGSLTLRVTSFVPDLPASSDHLAGHSAVARGLRATVEGEGAGLLAVVGGFGSGKSTVVELFQSRSGAEDAPDARVVIYDAWSHQADALRRSLLRFVLDALDPGETLAPNGTLAEARAAVGPPTSTTHTTARTHVGPWGLWAGLLAVLIPILVVFLAPAAQNTRYTLDGLSVVARSVDTHGLTALAVSLVVLVIAGAVALWSQKRVGSSGFTPDNERSGLFVQRVDTVDTVTSPAGEIDADAFERHFRAAVTAWMGAGEGRRLALVLDDLDRFPEADREKARAVLRSLHRVATGPAAVEGLWVIVPETPADPPKLTSVGDGTFTIERPGRDGDDWTDKLYLAQFFVPPALPAASASFLERLLDRAFPEHEPDERRAAARAWLWFGATSSPRRLVRFVNDLVALYRQHGDAHVPLRAQAAFLSTPSELALRLDDHERRRRETALGLGDWLAAAASLVYGLPPADALEILVRPRVSQAIASGYRGPVVKAAEAHPDAVLRVVEKEVHDLALGHAPHLLDHLAWLLGGLPEGPASTRAWDYLLREAPAVETWEDVGTDADSGRGVGLILSRAARTPHVLPALFRGLNAALTHPKERGREATAQQFDGDGDPVSGTLYPSDEDVERWATVVTNALASALGDGLDPTDLEGYRVPGGPGTYTHAVRAVAERGAPLDLLGFLRPEDPERVVAYLARAASASSQSAGLADTVQDLLAVHAPWDWTPLLDAIRQRLGSATNDPLLGQALSLGDAQEFVTTLLLLAHDPRSQVTEEASGVLRWCDHEGGLSHLAQIARVPEQRVPERGDLRDLVLAVSFPSTVSLALLLHADESLSSEAEEETGGTESEAKGREATAVLLEGDVVGTAGVARRLGLVDALRDRLPDAPETVQPRLRAILEATATAGEDEPQSL